MVEVCSSLCVLFSGSLAGPSKIQIKIQKDGCIRRVGRCVDDLLVCVGLDAAKIPGSVNSGISLMRVDAFREGDVVEHVVTLCALELCCVTS